MPALVWCLLRASFCQKSKFFSHRYCFSQLNQTFSKTFVTDSLIINSLWIPGVCPADPCHCEGLILLDPCLQLSVSSLATPQTTFTLETAVKPLHLGLLERNKAIFSAQTIQLPLLSGATPLHWAPVKESKAAQSWTICPISSICLPPALHPVCCLCLTPHRGIKPVPDIVSSGSQILTSSSSCCTSNRGTHLILGVVG